MNEISHNEKGLTLVEVLASIVILSIVVTTFLLVFTQTAKTTLQSEETVDATYIAQTEMENVYEMSRDASPYMTFEDKEGYSQTSIHTNWDSFVKHLPEDKLYVFLSFQEVEETDMTRVLIEVKHNTDDERPKAQMENLFKWKD